MPVSPYPLSHTPGAPLIKCARPSLTLRSQQRSLFMSTHLLSALLMLSGLEMIPQITFNKNLHTHATGFGQEAVPRSCHLFNR